VRIQISICPSMHGSVYLPITSAHTYGHRICIYIRMIIQTMIYKVYVYINIYIYACVNIHIYIYISVFINTRVCVCVVCYVCVVCMVFYIILCMCNMHQYAVYTPETPHNALGS